MNINSKDTLLKLARGLIKNKIRPSRIFFDRWWKFYSFNLLDAFVDEKSDEVNEYLCDSLKYSVESIKHCGRSLINLILFKNKIQFQFPQYEIKNYEALVKEFIYSYIKQRNINLDFNF